MPSDTLEIQPSVAATSVSFASPSAPRDDVLCGERSRGFIADGHGLLYGRHESVRHGLHAGASHITRHGVHKLLKDPVARGRRSSRPRRSAPSRRTPSSHRSAPEKKDDDTLHDSWTEPSVPQEDRQASGPRDPERNVVRSGLIKGGSSPTHEVDDADDLAAEAAEKAR